MGCEVARWSELLIGSSGSGSASAATSVRALLRLLWACFVFALTVST